MDEHEPVLRVDEPARLVRRLTLNRPNKRNALDDQLRSALFDSLRDADAAADVSVVVICGAGPSFCAGYDLSAPNHAVERYSSPSDGWWSRHVVTGWFEMWDMSTPLIAQVHGYCLAGGTELAAACDLVYVADDAQIGYPPVRLMSPPDLAWQPWLMGMRRAMEALLTGDAMSGAEAVQAGFANRAFPGGASRRRGGGDRRARRQDPRRPPRPQQACRPPRDGSRRDARRVASHHRPAGARLPPALVARVHEVVATRGVSAALGDRDKPFGDYRGSERPEVGTE